MTRPLYRLSLSEEEFDALDPVEQLLVTSLADRYPDQVAPPAGKPLRFKFDETPESAVARTEQLTDVDGGTDVTALSNLPKRNPR